MLVFKWSKYDTPSFKARCTPCQRIDEERAVCSLLFGRINGRPVLLGRGRARRIDSLARLYRFGDDGGHRNSNISALRRRSRAGAYADMHRIC